MPLCLNLSESHSFHPVIEHAGEASLGALVFKETFVEETIPYSKKVKSVLNNLGFNLHHAIINMLSHNHGKYEDMKHAGSVHSNILTKQTALVV